MTKEKARKIYRDKRKGISHSEKQKWDDLILIQFQKLNLPFFKTVFSYLPMGHEHEVETDAIVRYLQFINPELQAAYPVCNFKEYTMRAAVVDDDTPFLANKYGTEEPESSFFLAPHQIDIILVPLLCFDREGYRVGYGKGFYDKFLAQTKAGVVKIGLSYFDPVDKIDDRDRFDVTLSCCITPHQIYEF